MRTMIVTGASSGIGRALAERAARHGYDVLAVGRRVDRLADLERRAVGCPGRISTLSIDLRSPNAARIIVGAAQERFGGIDVLVNNAGGVAVGAITEQTDDRLHEQFETHVYAPLALTREALPLLRASHGHVFFFGSGVARVPVAGLGAYPPAKAAVRSMTRIVRAELRADGIAVTYVDPGAVDTEFMTRAGFDGPPKEIAASPDTVARRIMDAVYTRKSVVNAVPWQTAFVALAELFPAITDAVLARAPQIVGTATPPKIAEPKPPALPPLPPLPSIAAPPATTPPAAELSPFERALEPLARRMEKLNLSRTFVAKLLVPGAELDIGAVSLAWAGMPNKNERALTHEVLEALYTAGFLERASDETYVVVRAAE